jgi:hypothetical protein
MRIVNFSLDVSHTKYYFLFSGQLDRQMSVKIVSWQAAHSPPNTVHIIKGHTTINLTLFYCILFGSIETPHNKLVF